MMSRVGDALVNGIPNWLLKSGVEEVSEIAFRMKATMLQRRGVILIGHANVLLISLTLWLITGGNWALAWLLAESGLLCLRVYVYGKAHRAAEAGRPVDYRPLVATGFAWALLLGLGTAAAVAHGNPAAMLIAGVNFAGILGGISSRNGATPRYAMTLIVAAAAPVAISAWFSDIPWLFLVGVEVVLLVMAIIMVTFQNTGTVRAMLRAEYQNRRLSLTDALTGLGNRSALAQSLDSRLAAIAGGDPSQENRFALLCLDLDGFKAVNDTHGHLAGDMLLHAVSKRLDQCARAPDDVYRIGGDEFVMVLGAATPAETDDTCERILETLQQPFLLAGIGSVGIGVSIGSLMVDAPDGDTSAVLSRADAALYEAKRTGRNRHIAYDDALGLRLTASAMARAVQAPPTPPAARKTAG